MSVEQTGFIPSVPSPTDYVFGAETLVTAETLMPSGDWKDHLPDGERQNTPFTFDTMSCVTFSALNSLEMQIKRLIELDQIPQATLDWLELKGYMIDGEVNFSDRFTAMVSNTRPTGNTLTAVAEAIRKLGLIPQTLLPYGDAETWEEWHDKKDLRVYMFELGLEFLKYFTIQYEWVFWGDSDGMDERDLEETQTAIKHAPIQISVPLPKASHAIVMTAIEDTDEFDTFDSYPPYYNKKKWNGVYSALKINITPKTPPKTAPEAPETAFTAFMKLGSRGEQIARLQAFLNARLGGGIVSDGIFGKVTERAVKIWQASVGLDYDGLVGRNTRQALNEDRQPIPHKNFSEPIDKITGLNKYVKGLAQRIREELGDYMIMSNGLRTQAQNDAINDSASNSSHLRGLGFDFVCRNADIQEEACKIAEDMGVVRIGRYDDHGHIDIDFSLPQTSWNKN